MTLTPESTAYVEQLGRLVPMHSVTTGHDYAGRVLEHFKRWGG